MVIYRVNEVDNIEKIIDIDIANISKLMDILYLDESSSSSSESSSSSSESSSSSSESSSSSSSSESSSSSSSSESSSSSSSESSSSSSSSESSSSSSGSGWSMRTNGLETAEDDAEWTTENGSPDYSKDFGGFPLEGSQCLYMVANDRASIAVTAREETWITFMTRSNDNNENTENFVEFYNDSTLLATLICGSECDFKVKAEGGSTSAGINAVINIAVHIFKLRFKQGTGVNAEIEFWDSTDGTTWGESVSATDGTSTAQVNRIMFRNDHDTEVLYFDLFKEHNADIVDGSP